MKEENPIDETMIDASMLVGTTSTGITTAAKVARDKLDNIGRFGISNKIGKLIKKLEQ